MKPNYNPSYWEGYRERLIEYAVADAMQKDGEFYPFSVDNFGEALANINHTRLAVLAHFTSIAQERLFDQQASASVGECLRFHVWEYWKDMAKELIDRRTPEAVELFESGLAESHAK